MEGVFQVGEHSLVFDDPELCLVTWGEHITTEEVRALHDEVKRRAEGNARVFVLCDASRVKSVESNARKAMASLIDVKNLRGSVAFGMSFQIRVAALLLIKLIELTGRLGSCPIRMFATREEALAFIEELRRRA